MSAVVSVTPAYEIGKLDAAGGMETLRRMFPDSKADDLNFCLFSTSGTHGSYLTIEDVAESINGGEPERLTVLVVQPRAVRMLYGEIDVSLDDVPFLLALRESSRAVAGAI